MDQLDRTGRAVRVANLRGGSLSEIASEYRAALRWVRVLRNKGRKGGVIALVASAPFAVCGLLLLTGFSPLNGQEWWSPGLTFAGLALLALGTAGAMLGLQYLLLPQPLRLAPREDFLAALREAPKPVVVCLSCRIVVDGIVSCPTCLSAGELFEVATEADLRVVAAAIPDEAAIAGVVSDYEARELPSGPNPMR